MATLTYREHQSIAVGEGKALTSQEAQRFLALAERLRQPLNNAPVLSRHHGGLKTEGVVGVLAVPGRTLEILPKIDGEERAVRQALVHMIAVAEDVRVASGDLAALDPQRQTLLELVIQLFARRLLTAVWRGPPRRYVESSADLNVLRGRLDVVRQFSRFALRADTLACRFDELSADTPLNRVLKAAVVRLASVSRSNANVRRLAELAARLAFADDTADPLGEPVRLDRTNTGFHALYRLARLFLEGNWQSTTGGAFTGFSLLFPMNVLFERFIGKSLTHALYERVRLQQGGHSALIDAEGKRRFWLRPDVVIEATEGGRPLVLDTKWKRLAPSEPNLGVAQADVYQLLAYARAYGATRVVLLYPWHRALERKPGLLRRWSAPDAAGQGVRFDIATVDVASWADTPGVLRTIVGMQSLVERIRDGAKADADRLRARGWTKGDFANALGDLLDGRPPPLD